MPDEVIPIEGRVDGVAELDAGWRELKEGMMDAARFAGRALSRPGRLPGLMAGLGLTVAFAAPAQAAGTPVTNLPATLNAVSADSPSDAWAIGVLSSGRSLVLHWTGTAWRRVTIPDAGHSEIDGVAALSATDAWAVGAGPGSPAANTLVLRWNGTRWARVPSPSPQPGQGSSLTSVSAPSPGDALAVGDGASGPAGFVAIALRWNGTRWAKVSMPSPNNQTGLDGVSADSPSDAWAVGSFFVGQRERGYVVHWNGSTWTRVTAPNPGKQLTTLDAVSAVSRTDAWAVGSYFTGTTQHSLLLHWNGVKWSQVPGGPASSALAGVSALSSSDAWAVGSGPGGTLVLHWNGTRWAPVASPSPGGGVSFLSAVSADSPTDAWAVGCKCENQPTGGEHTVILHWNGARWLRT